MALNLSDLTGSSTSGDILAEVQTTADFLDSVPLLKNLADPSGATDAKQFTATKQPIALPLTKDSNGVLGGYCYLPDILGNAPAVTFPTIGADDDFVLEMDLYLVDTTNFHLVSGTATSKRIIIYNNGTQFQFNLTSSNIGTLTSPLNTGASKITCERTNGTFVIKQDGITKGTLTNATGYGDFTHLGFNGQFATGVGRFNGYIKKATLSIEGTEVLNVDFTSPRIPHGASEFECETGQVVTVNTSGNNPSKVIKKPVLRFIDSAGGALRGLFGQTLSEGYFFGAFSLNGDVNTTNRIFSVNSTGGTDFASDGFIYSLETGGHLASYNSGANRLVHFNMGDAARGDMLHEVNNKNLSCIGYVNGADEQLEALQTTGVSAEEFNIACSHSGGNTSLDLEYLAFFPATLTDAQADQVRNFINNRNKVFYRWDTDGYYFFDPSSTTDGEVLWAQAWNGRIVGSDNGDADMFIGNGTAADRPTTDGYKITFADNTDHFDIPSTTQAGWQIVGTSLGTFAYKVNGTTAVTELNLLGNLGSTSFRQAGDLYGIILLPESATNRDIQEARKLLIDRGAADGVSTSSVGLNWISRDDIIIFNNIDFSGVTGAGNAWRAVGNMTSFNVHSMPDLTQAYRAWSSCSNLQSFSTELPEVTDVTEAWWNCDSLSDFRTTDLRKCSYFRGAWRSCDDLQQFPQDALLGTDKTNVSFQDAWKDSGLQSFSTPLPTASRVDYAWRDCSSLSSFTTTDIKNCSNFTSAWFGCSSLTQFPQDAKLGTEVTGSVNFSNAWQSSGLTSFSTPLPTAVNCTEAWKTTPITSFNLTSLPEVEQLYSSFQSCTQLTSFSTAILKSKRMLYCWRSCSSLTDFSANVFANWNPSVINDRCFDQAWYGCTSLTTQSVENILVPIANSGKWATTNGLEGGTALTDATIDIDYDVTTGSLTAATLSAIETLNGRGWSVNINNEIIVPNILQLQPAAAYSLRSFDSDADPTVVNVRRSSDGSLSDFTASEVSDGTLTDWVNTDVVRVQSDFSSTISPWNVTYPYVVNQSIGGVDGALKLTINGSSPSVFKSGTFDFQGAGIEYTLNVDIYIPSSNSVVDGINISNTRLGVDTDQQLSADTWHNINLTGDATHGIVNNGFQLRGRNAASSTTDVIYIKNYTLTQKEANGHVTIWYDQSGSGNDSTQSTASSQPLIVQNGVLVTENGEAALSFLNDSNNLEMPYNDLSNQARLDSYYVTQHAAPDNNFVFPSNSIGKSGYIAQLNSPSTGITDYPSASLYTNSTLMTGNTRGDVWNAQNGYKLIVHDNGSTTGWGNNNIYFGQNGAAAGTYSFTGKLQEMIFFNTDQSANRVAIQNNINDHFNIY